MPDVCVAFGASGRLMRTSITRQSLPEIARTRPLEAGSVVPTKMGLAPLPNAPMIPGPAWLRVPAPENESPRRSRMRRPVVAALRIAETPPFVNCCAPAGQPVNDPLALERMQIVLSPAKTTLGSCTVIWIVFVFVTPFGSRAVTDAV
jgi:hypothetical protein